MNHGLSENRAISVTLLMLAVLPLWGSAVLKVQAQGKVKVVATFSILGDMVKSVGGDKIELKTLVGPDGDAHTFEPTPGDNKTLAEAGLIFENGLGFETWLRKLYTASSAKAKRVVITEGIEPLKGDHEGYHSDEHPASKATAEATSVATVDADHYKDHEDGEFDPHVWHDVKNAIQMVKNIRDGLSTTDLHMRRLT
jgi:zinc/manganese transport system substrate-binding protein